MATESPYPSARDVRLEQLERRLGVVETRVDNMRDGDQQAVLMVEVRNLKSEVRWLRYTLIAFIPLMVASLLAVLRLTGAGG